MRISSYAMNLNSQYEKLTTSITKTTSNEAQTATDVVTYEKQSLDMSANGNVVADGKNITFALDANLKSYDTLHYQIIKQHSIDPLVINLAGDVASVDSEHNFSFDLDNNGSKDEISLLSKNSAFLAYDKNMDGIINSGEELFGTKTGDGFLELAAYDDNKDGVIDEADEIFSKLSVWEKHASSDTLSSLNYKEIGAIFLQNTESKFELKSDGLQNAQIQKSGVALFESGKASWISHVDFVLQNKEEVVQEISEDKTALMGVLQSNGNEQPSSQRSKSLGKTIKNLKMQLSDMEAKIQSATTVEQRRLFEIQKQSLMERIAVLEKLSELDIFAS